MSQNPKKAGKNKNSENQPKKRLRKYEARLVDYYTNPSSETFKDWLGSYKRAGYSLCKQWTRNAAAVRAKTYIIQAVREAEAKYTQYASVSREYLIDKLQNVIEQPQNQAVLVSASREIADLCGYHKELAPNEAKEAARRALEAQEAEKYKEFTHERTDELSQEKPKTVKIGGAA